MENKPPKYVRLGHSALRLVNSTNKFFEDSEPSKYWRDAGHWEVEFRFNETDQKWYSVCSHEDLKWLDNVELIPISREEWKNDNEGYI